MLPARTVPGPLQSKLSVEDLEAKQRLVLRSCGVRHPYLHLPLAAFEDAGFFCVVFAVMDQVGHCQQPVGVLKQGFSDIYTFISGEPRTAHSR